jgi:hypothetical protein
MIPAQRKAPMADGQVPSSSHNIGGESRRGAGALRSSCGEQKKEESPLRMQTMR